MHTIENNFLKIDIHEKGAELKSIYSKSAGMEYLWNGDPVFWEKSSPILFPVVGALKNNTYFFDNRAYQLPRHGFAREKTFSVVDRSQAGITFSLLYDEETLIVYPFQFELRVHYSLNERSLNVTYEVKNRNDKEMYFSIGGHPAFKVPLLSDNKYEDHLLKFSNKENSPRWPVSHDGLIEEEATPFFSNDSVIPLKKELFLQDALVFKDLVSRSVSLKCNKHSHGLKMDFDGFPFLGIWAAKNADFVCIEPWCGIADSVHASQQLKDKEGIIKLGGGESFSRQWKLSVS